MKKSEWSDKQLEELLREMPRIQDHRDPRDIYQNLSLKKRKRPAWIIPGLATAAALFLFFLLLAPKLFNETQYSLDSAKQEESSSEEKFSSSEDNSSISMKSEDSAQNDNGISGTESKMLMIENNKNAVYEEDADTETVFTYWIPDSQIQFLIPVSILVTPDSNKDWLTHYTESMELLKEEEWGLTDYYPINANFELDNNTVMVDVPSDHKYGQGSASETMFIETLMRNMSTNSQVNKIVFTTDGQPGIELGNYGVIEEIEVKPEGKHAFFLYTPDGLDTSFHVPSIETYQDINTAFEAMKKNQTEWGLSASIGEAFPIKEVSIQDKKLILHLDENQPIENNLATIYSYEAVLLTAREFGFETITVLNAPIKFLGSFDLTKEMKVPVAPNYRPIQ